MTQVRVPMTSSKVTGSAVNGTTAVARFSAGTIVACGLQAVATSVSPTRTIPRGAILRLYGNVR